MTELAKALGEKENFLVNFFLFQVCLRGRTIYHPDERSEKIIYACLEKNLHGK